MEYEVIYNKKITESFKQRVESFLSNKMISSTISSDSHVFSFTINERLRDVDEKYNIIFTIKDSILEKIKISSLEADSSVNEIDLRFYVQRIIQDVLFDEMNNKTESYCIRNYYSYFNSKPFDIDLTLNKPCKIRIHSIQMPAKIEPLTEQIFIIDVQVEAINLKHAQSKAYSISKNFCAFLSVLLDVGFEEINSSFRTFVRYTDETKDKMVMERYRTGFLDNDLGIIVKDNMQGLKALEDKDLVEKFWTGTTVSYLTVNDSSISDSTSIIDKLSDNLSLEKKFKKNNCSSQRKCNMQKETIDSSIHYQNTAIEIPKCIRKYFSGIELLDKEKYYFFLSASRLYNLSLTVAKMIPTMEISYKVSCIDTLSKIEKIHFNQFVQKYVINNYNKEIIDFCYGRIRSGHFHSGEFVFTEYDINLCSEFDTDLKYKTDLLIKCNTILRECIVNWIKAEILK